MATFSIVIPVYNRPDEVNELLGSLADQSLKDFEVIVVEDGSNVKSKEVVLKYTDDLEVKYLFKENTGQGFSRNYAVDHTNGDWLVFFDSDCVIPENYIEHLEQLTMEVSVDAFCGPDAARADFSPLQKAISYAMTSFLTTGGIRGRNKKVDREAHLRSYNLVIKKSVFEELGGFAKTNMGEDMELSSRFGKAGYRAIISDKLRVYHKRRNSIGSFFKQVFSFGRTRIQLKRNFGIPIKLPHLFPTAFVVGLLFIPLFFSSYSLLGSFVSGCYVVYFLLILIHSSLVERSILVGLLSVLASFVQHLGYGLGFIKEAIHSDKT